MDRAGRRRRRTACARRAHALDRCRTGKDPAHVRRSDLIGEREVAAVAQLVDRRRLDRRLNREQLRHRNRRARGGLDGDGERDRARRRVDLDVRGLAERDVDLADVDVLRPAAAAAEHRVDDVRHRVRARRARTCRRGRWSRRSSTRSRRSGLRSRPCRRAAAPVARDLALQARSSVRARNRASRCRGPRAAGRSRCGQRPPCRRRS